ncbi:hypothetical protein G8764_12280 [Pseudomaricurvus alcaniphilus]|uniref:hypothetical protein n=1 Tax=Pseudomaricurvus alcaniphilus TaxID=1166482 RepID=UPI001409D183|nr:hypothetical protein [Pseudomaricurvus alcaniphilus]NHN38078.1 hypothetical protein [Pseudomaricurvus alcaniphilus]
MTNNRKEPTFSATPQDDLPPERPSASKPSGATAKTAAGGTQKARPAPVSGAPVAKSSPLVPLALLLALTGLGLAGFTYLQLSKSQQQVSLAEKRIAHLESRLQLSDSESTQSVAALQANLREAKESLELAHVEIRKLWDTRNVNKKAIADNSEQLESVAKTAKAASTAALAAQKQVQEQMQNWKALSSEVSLQVEQLRVISDLSQNQQKRLRELVDSSTRLESQFASLKSDVLGRLKTNEEAIQSIDNYRRIVNRDILQIKEQLSPSRP